MPAIGEWQWDDENIGELAAHGVSEDTVLDVWMERPGYRRNTEARPGYFMIGPDRGGTFWTVVIVEVRGKPGLWRAVTGWRAEERDINWYWGKRRRRT